MFGSPTPQESTPTADDLGAPAEVVLTAEQVMPLLYEELRRHARRERRRVGAADTLQTTAVVSEAYLKLRDAAGFSDRVHFLRSAALAMRHVLVNYTRDQRAQKRGGGAAHELLDEQSEPAVAEDERILEVNDALSRLKVLNVRLAQVVECRFFAGYDDVQTAEALGLTDRTVRRDWVKARAWLRRELDATGQLPESLAG